MSTREIWVNIHETLLNIGKNAQVNSAKQVKASKHW